MNEFNLLQLEQYKIDFDKVKDIEDVKNILKALNPVFTKGYEFFDILEPYVKKL